MVMGIIELFDELQKTRAELNLLRVQSGLSKIEGRGVEIKTEPSKTDKIFDLVIDEFVNTGDWMREQNLQKHFDKWGTFLSFNEWFKELTVEECVGYGRADKLLESAGKNDIKNYFKSGLERWYNEKTAIIKADAEAAKATAEAEVEAEVGTEEVK